MIKLSIISFIFAAFLFNPLSVIHAKQHPFSIHDMLAMNRISYYHVSPDGKKIVFTVRVTDLDANKGRTNLWLINTNGEDLRQLTTHTASDSNPRWSPCGKYIWFLSTRSGSSQVWRIRIDGGEAEQITDQPLDIGNLVVSADGKFIAFTMEVFPEFKEPEETKKKLDQIADRKSSGRIYTEIFIRHWDTWEDGRRSHLFVMPIQGNQVKDLMDGMNADTPSQPFGGPEEISFTPEGTGLIFTARMGGSKEAWSTNFDLYFVPLDGSQEPQCLTEKNKAWDTYPVFSPCGQKLAYLAMVKPGYESDRFRIIVRDWPQGEEQTLAENWDLSPSSLRWSHDGKMIYAGAANLGQHSLFSIDVATEKIQTIIKNGNIHPPEIFENHIIFGMDNLSSPVELYSSESDGSQFTQITHINTEKMSQAKVGEYEQFTFKGWNDETVYGYIVKPIDFDPGKKFPVAFLIHGGPQGSFGNNFHYRWNPQVYSGAGYAAVMVDFHGSVGYGQDFTDSIQGDWGGKPLEDLKKGLRAALDRYSWMDGSRVAALGASFGGFMINWIAGNWPDRFCCLVNHDGNLDERFAYFATEELWFPEWDHMGTPWTNPEGYEKFNPINYVKNWKTPMLIIHGAHDFRVVETQGMATFNALQRLGIPSKLLYFPDENHWVLKPHNSILWHNTVIAWLDQWCKNNKK
jgi:dipeptidyl aminopeptidase/acylaminoacyl peptidase